MIKTDFIGNGDIINAFVAAGQADEIYQSITGQEHPQKVEAREQSLKLRKLNEALNRILNDSI